MIRDCKFNKAVDICALVDGLAADLNQIVATGVVPSTAGEVVYNGIDDVSKIGSRCADVFAAMDAMKGIASSANSTEAE